MTSPTEASAALFERARAVTPGGVNSPVRAFNAVGGTPRFIERASGPYLFDVDGTEYVDLVGSWGPMLLGHAHPQVLAAVQAAVARGTSYGTPTRPEVELAEAIVARTPVEKVRLVSSGTEATMSAIRLARGFTGRELVVKFAGCYHGHVDSLLAQAGSGLATFAVPGTPGVPAASTAATLVLPYNDPAAVAAVFEEHGDEIACVITEAAPGNMGVVPPAPGFNRLLAETCREHGALFVSDEVMTGFRVTASGHWGLDGAVEGWSPDLTTFGKVMGGGFPAAAFGGRADVMSMLSPGRTRLPGRDALGEPRRDHGRPRHAPAGDRRGLRPPRQGRPGGPRGRWCCPGRGRGAARRAARRQHVQRVLHRRGRERGPRLRGRVRAASRALQGVLPLDAGPGRLPPAERVRGVVPLRGPRRPRPRPDPVRPARRRTSGAADEKANR